MHRTSLIGHIIELYELVRSQSQPADNTVKEFLRNRHYLGSHDRRYVSEALYGMLRHTRYLEENVAAVVDSLGGESLRYRTSSVALYAAYAVKVLGESPESATSAMSSLWHAFLPFMECESFFSVLHQADVLQSCKDDPSRRISIQYSFPEEIVAEWLDRFKEDETESLCAALNSPAPTAIRINTLKVGRKDCLEILSREGVECEPALLSPDGIVLKKRINANSLRSFKDGLFEMQDEGSQLLALLTDAAPGETVVDACAGGGGKSLHLACLMENRGKLMAVDVDERRLAAAKERTERAGVLIASMVLVPRDARTIASLSNQADAVLIDAPCSGVGTFRRNPAAKLSFSFDLSDRFVNTQRQLLTEYASLVKPGGRLVYSTCTLLKRENEENIEWFMKSHPEFSLVNPCAILERREIRIENDSPFLILFPHKTNTDGFFAAVMLKTESGR